MPSNDIENARILIDQKRYAEARFALKSINHPTALEWLAYLDRIDPPRRKKKGISWRYAFMLVILIFMGSVVAYQQVSLNYLIDRVNSQNASFTGLSGTVDLIVTDVDSLGDDVDSLVDDVNTHAANLLTLSSTIDLIGIDLSDLVNVVNSHADDINSLSSSLYSVSLLAENANRYAHSHGFSDVALKMDVASIESPLERILSLRGVAFTWRDAEFPDLNLEHGRDFGVLAQELAVVFPELVTQDPETGFLQVDYEGLIPVLIEAIRQQQQQIEELRALMP